MRDHAKVLPQFWTGPTGKRIREAGRDAQVVALYLVTGPHANMIGLYYLPLPTLCHEVGITAPAARRALRALAALDFAHYDDGTEHVWLPEMARYQIGLTLKPADKRVHWVQAQLEQARHVPFVRAFLARYAEPFHLTAVEAPSEPLPSPFEWPSKPLRSQETETEQEITPPSRPPRGTRARSDDGTTREGFERFWAAYPRKADKLRARRAWAKLAPQDGQVETILCDVERRTRSRAWMKDDGDFIPYPATYLNGRRWEDELEPAPGPEPWERQPIYSDADFDATGALKPEAAAREQARIAGLR